MTGSAVATRDLARASGEHTVGSADLVAQQRPRLRWRLTALIALSMIVLLGACSDSADGASVDVTLPDVSVSLPDVSMPDVSLPDVSLPDVSVPDVSLPDVTLPSAGSSDSGSSDSGSSDSTAPAASDSTAPAASNGSSDSSGSSDNGFPIVGLLVVAAVIFGFVALLSAASDRQQSQQAAKDAQADQTQSGIDDVVTKAQWADEQVSKVLASANPGQLASVDSTLQWHLAQLETSTGNLADDASDTDTATALGGVGSAIAGLRGALSAYLSAASSRTDAPHAAGQRDTQLDAGGGAHQTTSFDGDPDRSAGGAVRRTTSDATLDELRTSLDRRRRDLDYATQRLTALRNTAE